MLLIKLYINIAVELEYITIMFVLYSEGKEIVVVIYVGINYSYRMSMLLSVNELNCIQGLHMVSFDADLVERVPLRQRIFVDF